MSFVFDRPYIKEDYTPLVLWDNILEGSTVTATGSTSEGPIDNILDGYTYDYWIMDSSDETATFTLDETKGASYLGLASHNLGSSGATLTLEYYKDGSWEEASSVSPEDDTSLILAFWYKESSSWRISISGGACQVGVISLGVPTYFTSGILPSYTPLYMAEEVDMYSNVSISGHFLGNMVERLGYSTDVNLNILERDFVQGEEFQSFRKHYNYGKTFFWASQPRGIPDDVAYCVRDEGEPMQPNFPSGGNFYSVSLSLRGYIS